MKKHLFLLLVTVALLIGNQSYAQKGVAINTTGADAASSALLDVSSLTKGVLIPRMTAVQRAAIVSPVKGLLVYQDDGTEGFYYYDGAAWTRLASGTYTETDPVVKAINGVVKSDGTTISAAVAGTDYLTPTGSAASLTNFPTLNQNTSGTAANVTGIVAVANGGTGATTDAAAFDALSPMTTQGDVIYGGTSGTGTRLAKGNAGQVLTMNSGATAPQWSAPATGTVTEVTGTAPIVSSGGTAPVISLGTVPVANGGTGSTTQNFVDLTTAQTVAGNKTLSGNTAVDGTLAVTGVATLTAAPVLSSTTASQALFTNASKNVVSNPITGTGNVVMSNSPTLVTPTLGVASATSVNGLTPTALATGFTLSGGTVSETLTVPSDATVSGTNTGDNAVNTLYSGLTSNATHTGDAVGATYLTVKKINGVALSGLLTGILKNTNTTGVPSIAVDGTDYLSSATGWRLSGNTGTDPATNFIGTKDNTSLIFKVNNVKAGEISSGSNTSFGYEALISNTTGTFNTANGRNALRSNTTGGYNTANGVNALLFNTEGNSNVAIGYQALTQNLIGSKNTASGYYALSNTTGNNNTASGYNALKSNISGYGNTAAGYYAGTTVNGGGNNQTSYNSIYLGAETKAFADGQNNEIVIGYNATGAGSNTVTLGNTSITSTVLRGSVSATRYVLTQPSAITSAATTTIDLSLGNVFQVNLGANIGTLTLTNPAVGTYLVKLTQDATGGRTVAFPAAWKWSGGTAPIVTATAAKTDIVTLIYDGTTYYATIVQNF